MSDQALPGYDRQKHPRAPDEDLLGQLRCYLPVLVRQERPDGLQAVGQGKHKGKVMYRSGPESYRDVDARKRQENEIAKVKHEPLPAQGPDGQAAQKT
jgi:hypothetical protein